MEGKKSSGSGAPTRSLVDDLFGGKNSVPAGKYSSSSGLFDSVLPPASTVKGNDSSRTDLLDPSRKQEADGHAVDAQKATADGISHGSTSKGNSINKERNSVYHEETIEPCYLSSSLYYGGQDFCALPASSRSTSYNRKKDGGDDPNNSNAASRGNWWEGSLYY